MAAAGLALDVNTLFYSGVAVFVLMAALWLWTWARPIQVEVPVYIPAPPPPEPEPAESKDRAIWVLKKARDNAAVALRQGNALQNERAYNEIMAALLTIKREFGIREVQLIGKGSVPFPSLLKVLISYMDKIIPLLREDHIQEARSAALSFGWHWQDEDLDVILRIPRVDLPKA